MIRIQYFASVRETLGLDAESVEAPDGTFTVEHLMSRLAERHGDKWREAARGGAVLVAVNHAMAKRSAALRAGDEVAFFPPVTGG